MVTFLLLGKRKEKMKVDKWKVIMVTLDNSTSRGWGKIVPLTKTKLRDVWCFVLGSAQKWRLNHFIYYILLFYLTRKNNHKHIGS